MITRLSSKALPPQIADKLPLADRRALRVRTTAEIQASIDLRGERELQRACESYLAQRGYARLTAADAERIAGDAMAARGQWTLCRGWFGHWPEARRNPLAPDLLVWTRDMRRCLAVELKVRDVYQPGQREMIRIGAWLECRTFEDFAAAVVVWEIGEP